MFYIVEFQPQINELKSMVQSSACFVHVIGSNDLYHPNLQFTSAVYIKVIEEGKGFIIPIQHDEGIDVDKDVVLEVLKECKELYVVDKKYLLYHFNIQSAIDLSLLAASVDKEKPESNQYIPILNWYRTNWGHLPELNTFMPISKLFEKCELIYEDIVNKELLHIAIRNNFDFYNRTATNVFYLIEKAGLGVSHEFTKVFNVNTPEYNIDNGIAYTYYNLYNITSRPTNAFNSINFAAIPKDEKHRTCIVPLNDMFVEVDFDGYHLRLIADLIDYEMTSESAHLQLAKKYMDKEELSEEDYKEAKKIHFHAMYGNVPEKYKKVAFFKKISDLSIKLWNQFETDGYIEDPISKKKFERKVLEDMNPTKLMNYLMQSLETSRNIVVLKSLLRYLKDKKTKIRLYTYDAIVLDVSKEDGKESLLEIKELVEENGKFPVHLKRSSTLLL